MKWKWGKASSSCMTERSLQFKPFLLVMDVRSWKLLRVWHWLRWLLVEYAWDTNVVVVSVYFMALQKLIEFTQNYKFTFKHWLFIYTDTLTIQGQPWFQMERFHMLKCPRATHWTPALDCLSNTFMVPWVCECVWMKDRQTGKRLSFKLHITAAAYFQQLAHFYFWVTRNKTSICIVQPSAQKSFCIRASLQDRFTEEGKCVATALKRISWRNDATRRQSTISLSDTYETGSLFEFQMLS